MNKETERKNKIINMLDHNISKMIEIAKDENIDNEEVVLQTEQLIDNCLEIYNNQIIDFADNLYKRFRLKEGERL